MGWDPLPHVDPPSYLTWGQQFAHLMARCGIQIPQDAYPNPFEAIKDAQEVGQALNAPGVNFLIPSISDLVNASLLPPPFFIIGQQNAFQVYRAFVWCLKQSGYSDQALQQNGLNPSVA